VAVDLGIKTMTPTRMAERGLEVHVVPSTASFAEIEARKPDGVFFSNGPAIRPLPTSKSSFCGRSSLLAFRTSASASAISSSAGPSVRDLQLGYGHRGINQPVMDLTTRKVEVTSHNHGFAVAAAPGERHQTPYGIAQVSHICLNDDVVEGLQLSDADGRLLAFSVQYHPEAAAGPP
jgi:carbamoyl-phosphate synthase small subunit